MRLRLSSTHHASLPPRVKEEEARWGCGGDGAGGSAIYGGVAHFKIRAGNYLNTEKNRKTCETPH
ncbi:hypothetical protein B9Q03_14045 [Candidatus Marsarchaeota G2 archaeon OSP_D]|uniref:Uncharacterized protein n=1 Tax=Candidatus Marsarchaeota G2 archaeon OSP_D TaxID=1978157 RepID=A0A2R6A880_9ARCH|nr:MAG: hypothetical protein B9Q03_14045 [Candidatus Marsarchaeota G2 archaeon OSP_D]